MSNPANVSLTMIVRNEEKNLRDCIAPIAHLFSEIIVVDTGSTDRTKALARELGAQVHDFPWCDNFAAARNEAIRHATGDWIFWMDADDRMDAENVERLAQLLSTLGKQNEAYMMGCISLAVNSTEAANVIPHCRLFRRHPEVVWKRRVHEQIAPSLEALGHVLVQSDVRIEHHGYQDIGQIRKKTNRDLRLLRLEYATNPTDPHTLFFLGRAYMNIGQPGEALTYLLSSMKYAPHDTGNWVRLLYATVSDAFLQLGRREEALGILADGLEKFAFDPGLATRRADILCAMGAFGEAERALVSLVQRPRTMELLPGSEHVLELRSARYLLGHVYRAQGRNVDAERVFQEILAQAPDFIMAWIGLGYLYLDQRKFSDVRYVAHQLEKCPQGAAYMHVLTAEIQIAQGEMDSARELLDQAISLAPRLPLARLVLSEWLLKSGAANADCQAACRDVLRLDPGNPWANATLEALIRRESGQMEPQPGWFSVTIG